MHRRFRAFAPLQPIPRGIFHDGPGPENVLGPPEGRKKLVVVGDTETTDGLTCLMIRPGTFRAMMALWQCGRKRTKCCDACKTAD